MKLITERLIIRTFEEADLLEFEKLLNIPEVPGWQMQKKPLIKNMPSIIIDVIDKIAISN